MSVQLSYDPHGAASPELLRAVRMRFLLRGFGRVMSESHGSERTFNLSKPTTAIALFLSHSWSTPGWFKTIALMYYANVKRALVAGFIVAAIIWTLELAGVTGTLMTLYTWNMPGEDKIFTWHASHTYAPCCLAFFIVLIFGQELPGMPQHRCFLDKCCIHQTDHEKKMQGIQLLGQFLHCSDKLVILWQPEYLTRLWCVYELAAFRHIKGGDDNLIEFLPLKLPLLTVGLFFFHWMATFLLEITAPLLACADWHAVWIMETFPVWVRPLYFWSGLFWCLFVGVYLLVGYSLWTFCRSHMDDRRTLLKQLSEFQVTKAECLHDNDREFVEGQIRQWFGSIDQFEREVQGDVTALVARQLHEKEPMPWNMIFVGAISHVFFSVSHMVELIARRDWYMLAHMVMFGIGLSCFTDAIAMSVALRLADRARDWGWNSRASNIKGGIMVAALFAFSTGFAGLTLSPALPMPLAAAAFLLLAAVTWLLYFTKLRHHAEVRRSRSSLSDESEAEREQPASVDEDLTEVKIAQGGVFGEEMGTGSTGFAPEDDIKLQATWVLDREDEDEDVIHNFYELGQI